MQYIEGTVVSGVKWWLLGAVYRGNCCVWCEVGLLGTVYTGNCCVWCEVVVVWCSVYRELLNVV